MAEIVSGGAALSAVVLYALIAWRMRTAYPQEWVKLGSPGGLHDPTELGSLKFAEYIWKAKWVALNDMPICSLCIAFYLSVAIMVAGFLGVTTSWVS